MKIGLIDVDGHNFPNFALMKISAWHKSHGDTVEWTGDMYWDFDRVYKSKIFTFTPDNDRPFPCEVIKGDTGYDVRSRLPERMRRLKSTNTACTSNTTQPPLHESNLF
jgi:hypothetical protein